MTQCLRPILCLLLRLTPGVAIVEASAQEVGPAGPASPADAAKADRTDGTAVAGYVVTEQITKLLADDRARRARYRVALREGKDELRRLVDSGGAPLGVDVLAHQLVDLAAQAPMEQASRDALIWVIHQPGRGDGGVSEYTFQFSRAVDLLVHYHADDPEVARVGLTLDRDFTRRRDAFVEGVYANAKGREARGLARLALGQYLARKASFAEASRTNPTPPPVRFRTAGRDGKPVERSVDMPPDQKGYWVHRRLLNPDDLRAEAERLLEEVIADYGDISYVSPKQRDIEAMLRETPPGMLSGEDETQLRIALNRMLARKETLADSAESMLDDMHNLTAGKLAPEVAGTDLEGRPLKLSDYRGKVVVVVFWGSWCGPCLQEVPHEKELVERHKGRPFALLGVDCEESKQAGLDAVKAQGMAWPHWFDGPPGEGPIARLYHVRSYPSIYVVDAGGILRGKKVRGSSVDKIVDELLDELGAQKTKGE